MHVHNNEHKHFFKITKYSIFGIAVVYNSTLWLGHAGIIDPSV